MFRTKCIPKCTPSKERDFFSYLDFLKCEQTVLNPNHYFQNVKVINFDMTNHVRRGDPLEEGYSEHYAVKNSDFKNYPASDKKNVVGGTIQNDDKTKQEIVIKKDVVFDHFCNKK